MASCVAVPAFEPQPGASGPMSSSARAGGGAGDALLDARRRLARLRVAQQALEQCLGARSAVWLARAAALGFAIAAFYAARPLPETHGALVHLALVTFSWCAGLAALSAAGPAPARLLEAGRGLLLNRGVPLSAVRAEQPLALSLWVLRRIGVLALLIISLALVATPEPLHAAHLLGLGLGALIYLGALGLGLGLLAQLCHVVGAAHGQALLLGVVLIPELLSPAWPGLPTLASSYAGVLDACLQIGLGR